MSGAGLIELLAARLGGRGARRAAPGLREVLASAMPDRSVSAAEMPAFSVQDSAAISGSTPSRILRDGQGGSIRFYVEPDTWDVIQSYVPETMRGKGRGSALYGELARMAEESGKRIRSDTNISPAARRMYEGLRKRGLDVRDGGSNADFEVVPRSVRNASRTGPDAGPSQAGRTPSNVSVSITNRGGLRQIDWDLKDGSESFSLAHRAAAEREGIDAAVAAFDADIVRHPNARYYIEPITRALARRYRRMAGERGFAMEPHGNGYILSRTAPDGGPLRDGPNAGSDRNALQRALRDRMNRE